MPVLAEATSSGARAASSLLALESLTKGKDSSAVGLGVYLN